MRRSFTPGESDGATPRCRDQQLGARHSVRQDGWVQNDALRAEILAMFAADQAAVQKFIREADEHREVFELRAHETDVQWPYALLEWDPPESAPPCAQEVVNTVAQNIQRLREIVAAHGWPGRRLVGEDGTDAAWTLLRHAGSGVRTIGTPQHQQFQRDCLPMLQEGVRTRDVQPRQFAAIADALQSLEGRPPQYAVQADDYEIVGGAPRFRIEADVVEIDENRASIGLPPLATDIERRERGDPLYVSGPLRADPWRPLE